MAAALALHSCEAMPGRSASRSTLAAPAAEIGRLESHRGASRTGIELSVPISDLLADAAAASESTSRIAGLMRPSRSKVSSASSRLSSPGEAARSRRPRVGRAARSTLKEGSTCSASPAVQ